MVSTGEVEKNGIENQKIVTQSPFSVGSCGHILSEMLSDELARWVGASLPRGPFL